MEQGQKPENSAASRIVGELVGPFAGLFHSSRALFGVNLTYCLEGLTYFGLLTLLQIFLIERTGLDDITAGWTVGILTSGITLSMVVLGAAVDWFGPRRAITMSLLFFLAGRIVITVSPSFGGGGAWGAAHLFALLGIFGIIIGNGIYQPACYAGVKLFTGPATAAMGYAMIYGVMNLGGFLPGLISPPLRRAAGIEGVFWFYCGITAVEIALVAWLLSRKNVEKAIKEAEVGAAAVAGGAAKEGIGNDPLAPLSGREKWVYYLKHLPLTDLRFVFFICALIPVQTLFAHNWLTIPLYTSRAFSGIVAQNFEFFSNLNPLLIFVLAPVVTALTAKKNTYGMMIAGTLVMAAPAFLLALGPRVETLMAYLIFMSIGEAMWSPRFLQWISEMAPKNMTGIYMGIGQLPWFLTKALTSAYSGWFLMHYCPADTPPADLHTGQLWLIYGLIAIVSPLGLMLARPWMMKGWKDRNGG